MYILNILCATPLNQLMFQSTRCKCSIGVTNEMFKMKHVGKKMHYKSKCYHNNTVFFLKHYSKTIFWGHSGFLSCSCLSVFCSTETTLNCPQQRLLLHICIPPSALQYVPIKFFMYRYYYTRPIKLPCGMLKGLHPRKVTWFEK